MMSQSREPALIGESENKGEEYVTRKYSARDICSPALRTLIPDLNRGPAPTTDSIGTVGRACEQS